MLGMLNILETFDVEKQCYSPEYYHLLIEAMKFAFGARSEISDPAFAEKPERFNEFFTKEWAKDMSAKITVCSDRWPQPRIWRQHTDPQNVTHDGDYYGLKHDTPGDHGTTHMSTVDRWGGAASITSTVNLIWGSRVMDPDTGIIFNDEQGGSNHTFCWSYLQSEHQSNHWPPDDFSVPGAPNAFDLWPSPWNYPAPSKKPLSSTSPSIILYPNGTLYGVFGGSGGSRIFPALAQVLLNLECGLDLSAAIEKERYHAQIVPDEVQVEVGPAGADKPVEKGLKARGHIIREYDINRGVSESGFESGCRHGYVTGLRMADILGRDTDRAVQGVILEHGKVIASSDSRKNGVAAAY
jgi:gamma-glutamyltranspeptidase/glutathione hydrolase/leukotriene-C4 hydrolase